MEQRLVSEERDAVFRKKGEMDQDIFRALLFGCGRFEPVDFGTIRQGGRDGRGFGKGG